MKMLKNGLEADAFAISRIPIQSPQSTKRVDVLRYAARPLARPAPGHHDPHAEDGVVAEDAAVDEVTVLRKQKKRYKNRGLPATVPKCVAVVEMQCAVIVEAPNVNAPRLDDHHVDVGSRVGRRRSSWISKKASSC